MRRRRGSDELGLVRPATDAPPPEFPDVQVAVAAERLADGGGIGDHDASMARLQRKHGRRYSLWKLLDTE